MEKETFNRLVKETKKWVFATAYNITGNRAEAEDVMQETFLTLYNHYDTLQSKEAVYSWIKKVAVNKAINASKKNIFVQVADFVMESIIHTDGDDSERILYSDQMMSKLHEGLETLSPEHRAIIILREIDNMSYEDIAAQIGCSVGTVMSRLFYARKQIRKYLEKRK